MWLHPCKLSHRPKNSDQPGSICDKAKSPFFPWMKSNPIQCTVSVKKNWNLWRSPMSVRFCFINKVQWGRYISCGCKTALTHTLEFDKIISLPKTLFQIYCTLLHWNPYLYSQRWVRSFSPHIWLFARYSLAGKHFKRKRLICHSDCVMSEVSSVFCGILSTRYFERSGSKAGFPIVDLKMVNGFWTRS